MKIILWLLFVAILHISSGKQYQYIAMNQRRPQKCQKVESKICLTKVSQGYNSTIFPNHVGHNTQEEAIRELRDFEPLIESGCSKYLSTFLCSLYFPICTPGLLKMGILKPCRSLCEKSAVGCKRLLQKYGYKWRFNCTQFPDPKESGEFCVESTAIDQNEVAAEKPVKKEKKHRKKGRVAGGSEDEKLEMKCPKHKYIFVKKVLHFGDSTCCKSASKAVLTAMCNGKHKCKFSVSPSDLGGHCKTGQTGQIMVRYRCTSSKDKNCSQQNTITRKKSKKNTKL